MTGKTSFTYETCSVGTKKIITIYWTAPAPSSGREFDTTNKSIGEIQPPHIHLRIRYETDKYILYYSSGTALTLKGKCYKAKLLYIEPTPQDSLYYYGNTSKITTTTSEYEECPVKPRKYCKIVPNTWKLLVRDKLDEQNSCITFKCMFKIVNNKIGTSKTNLNNDLEIMLKNGLFSDVTIKSIDNKEFKAHKAILASRSPVFKANFEHENIQKNKNAKNVISKEVESPLEAHVLREILTFIYTDEIPMIDEIPKELFVAADYYQLSTSFKNLCEETLRSKLTAENAIDTLVLADRHSADKLKQWTLEFIKNEKTDVMKTKAWAELESVELIKTICEFI